MTISTISIKKAWIISGLLFSCISCKQQEQPISIAQSFNGATQQLEQEYKGHLQLSRTSLLAILATRDIDTARVLFEQAHDQFKQAEPVFAFNDIHNYTTLNAPNILKVEEEDATDIKIKEPIGFQVIEELIYDHPVDTTHLFKVINATQARLGLVEKNTDLSHYKKHHIMWLLRQQIMRTTLTGTTGFDRPVTDYSLKDAGIAFAKAKHITTLFKNEFTDTATYNDFIKALTAAQATFTAQVPEEFDHFDFIKNHVHPLLQIWNKCVKDWKVVFPFELAIKNEASSLFSKETFNLNFYAEREIALDTVSLALGKKLFNDKRLSADGSMSCATCHASKRAFTDGLKRPKGLTRNSPSLTYAAYQQDFFYDKRSGSLEGQIVSVVNNEHEFHSDLASILSAVKKDSTYVSYFKRAYNSEISEQLVRNSIAEYVSSLNDWDSTFDKNINGTSDDLSPSARRGFNLFMGKAQCATCHFAPVFNGTVPPDFTETEMELLGVPSTAVTSEAVIDPDLGRYELFKTENRKYFFKTPSLRNVAVTGPYMHNGVYETLEEVMDFYNRGGGAGIGIDEPYQTLPTDPLNLTEQEITDIIQFMHSLTDQRYQATH
jgi:cytochrome c peroxidase